MWVESRPFDIGNNARTTIGMMDRVKEQKSLAAFALQNGAKSTKSMSNGSLMRIAPLAVWASNVTEIDDLKKIISLDVSFTHSNQLVHDAVLIYSAAIGFLVRNFNEDGK